MTRKKFKEPKTPRRRVPMQETGTEQSVVCEEVPVMGMERRGCIRQSNRYSTEQSGGDKGEKDKTIQHSEAIGYASLQACQS